MAGSDTLDAKEWQREYYNREIHRDRSLAVFAWAAVAWISGGAITYSMGASDEAVGFTGIVSGILGGVLSFMHQERQREHARRQLHLITEKLAAIEQRDRNKSD